MNACFLPHSFMIIIKDAAVRPKHLLYTAVLVYVVIMLRICYLSVNSLFIVITNVQVFCKTRIDIYIYMNCIYEERERERHNRESVYIYVWQIPHNVYQIGV